MDVLIELAQTDSCLTGQFQPIPHSLFSATPSERTVFGLAACANIVQSLIWSVKGDLPPTAAMADTTPNHGLVLKGSVGETRF